jgi:hypothetical protein
LLAARIAEQEAELAAWMKEGPDAEEAQRIAGGNGYHTSSAAAAAAGAGAGDGQQQQDVSPAAAAAAAAEAARRKLQQQGKQPRQPPLTQVQLCELAGLPADAPWDPARLMDEQLASVLQGVWGHSGFRGQQLPLIRAALQGTSMLGVLPTGLGKSLTYQLPALLLQGECWWGYGLWGCRLRGILWAAHANLLRRPVGAPCSHLLGLWPSRRCTRWRNVATAVSAFVARP